MSEHTTAASLAEAMSAALDKATAVGKSPTQSATINGIAHDGGSFSALTFYSSKASSAFQLKVL